MRSQLQIFVAQICYHTGEFEQLEVVMERRWIKRDLHRYRVPFFA
jgi:hypothetical protein